MLRHLSGPTVKALLLGFFCCLSASSCEEVVTQEPEPEILSLRKVHPNNDQLLSELKAGRGEIPRGYEKFQQREIDWETNKIIGEKVIILSSNAIVTNTHIDEASTDEKSSTIKVTLTEEGGKRLAKATKEMTMLVDRLAIVCEGRCIIAPTIAAILDRQFIIDGLVDQEEANRITKALNEKRQNNFPII